MEQEAGADAAQVENGRTSVRDSMLLVGTIRRGPREGVIRVRNLSAGGLMAEVAESFLIGEAVEVDLRGLGLVPGHIAWTSGTRIGVAFAHEVDPRFARRKVIGLPQPMLMRAATSTWRPPVR